MSTDAVPRSSARETNAIGDRFAADPTLVADLGRAAAEGLDGRRRVAGHQAYAGHGRATVDSHLDLPRIDADLDDLAHSDFVPFRMLNDLPWGHGASGL